MCIWSPVLMRSYQTLAKLYVVHSTCSYLELGRCMSDIQVQHTYLHVWYLYFSNVVCFTAKAELVLKKKPLMDM